MVQFHREGRSIIRLTVFILFAVNVLAGLVHPWGWWFSGPLSVVVLVLVLQFFRNPPRPLPTVDANLIYAPADGQICVLELAHESEYFQEKRLQVSIFMSPLNVHVNRNPVSGTVCYYKYHSGSYLVAWHPKSSTENERTTVVYDTGRAQVLLRQIAGAVARRIICYIKSGDQVQQGEDMGFIRFGSRVDLFLPPDAQLDVALNQMVRGNETVIARLP
jgi:phosphatidylserine decarboxylase